MTKVAISGVDINYEKAGSGSSVALCMPGAMGKCSTKMSYRKLSDNLVTVHALKETVHLPSM